MTGEITLTGQVLQIGGLREKVLAAQRAGLEKVILPRENEADLTDLPAETREQVEFILADTIEAVLAQAFDERGGGSPAGRRHGASGSRGVCVKGRRVRQCGVTNRKDEACVQRRRRIRTRSRTSGAP